MRWLNIFTVNLLAQPANQNNLKNIFAKFLGVILVTASLAGCATSLHQAPQAGVPVGPTVSGGASDASLNSLLQGLNYLREHPSTREDEKIERFLWLDQWLKILQDKNRLTPEMAQEFWGDLTSLVKENPAVSAQGLQRINSGTQTKLGKNISYYYLYLALLKDQSLESALKNLEFVEEDSVSDLYSKSQGLLQLFKNKAMSDSRKIGVLLPLSGDLKPLGEEVLQAIQVAGNLSYANGIEFVVEDIGTSEADLLKAWDKLAVQEKVTAIIGPLTSKESELIFERAQILSIPVISLAPKEGLQGFGNYSFQSVLSLDDQVKRLAKHMADDLRAKRVAVLLPDSSYGWDVMEAAKKEFDHQGLQITQMQVYKVGTTDFKDQLRRMTRLDVPKLRKDEVCSKEKLAKDAKKDLKSGEPKPLAPSGAENSEVAAPPIEPTACVKKPSDLRPLIDFEVLFAPDSAEAAGFLLPTLPYLRIYGVEVIGLSQYNSPKLIERAGDHAEGVIFTDGYLPNSNDFQNRFFREQYQKTAQKDPTRLSAEAFDLAMIIVKVIRDAQGPLTREMMAERLKNIRDFPGTTGSIFYEDHKLKKEPKLLTVRNGTVQELRLKD
ncbi:MAG: hypothetical protein JWQ35_1599 [Bacteriovoracaceae bacterium]|nr:hypothetical protein [Bacteriovoracaceae bacterium]